ncbi:MAG TPA: hypothetical protein VH637_01505 [Streptosporangiaceae bacterium]|jgi:hypothetical protein
MSTGTTVVIVVIAIIVIGAVAAVVISASRRRRLQQRFGPEYGRLVERHDSKLKAEAELTRRERRVSKLDIRPLSAASRARYAREWATIQEQFVDAPSGAVSQAHQLVLAVLAERGYRTEDQRELLEDLSVHHAGSVDHFRAAADAAGPASTGTSSTEELRQGMIHYRALFQDLLGEPADTEPAAARPSAAEHAATEPAPAGPAAAGRTDAEPPTAEPADTEPAGAEPAGAEPAGAEPADAEPAAADRTAAEPADAEPITAEPADAEPTATKPAGRWLGR